MMKKTITLILVMLVCLGGFAYASEEDAAFDAACALMDAGRYDEALEAFASIGRYREISEKIAEIQRMKDEQDAGFLYGTWINLRDDVEYTFESNGEAYTSENQTLTYVCKDGVVQIRQPWRAEFAVAEIDGIPHLQAEGYDMIREADYEAAGPKAIQITMENWETYFEVREAVHLDRQNAFGEFQSIQIGYGVFLRPEYAQRIANPDGHVQVSFKYSITNAAHEHYFVEFDMETLELKIIEPVDAGSSDDTAGTIDVRYYAPEEYSAKSQFCGHYVAGKTEGIAMEDFGNIWQPVKDFAITDAVGTLMLLPE